MGSSNQISVHGARTHNLKNITVSLPRDRLTVVTGLSGSGKSSLAYDTIYAEGQRRYVESLSAYARQFLSLMEKPDVDGIEGLSPAISIHQKAARFNPRSTVGTVTEIYDYLRLLYARAGEPKCPEHGTVLKSVSASEIADRIMAYPQGSRIALLAPVVKARKGEHIQVFESLRKQGFVRVRVNGTVYDIDEAPRLEKYASHTIEVVVDRLVVRDDVRSRLVGSVETAAEIADGFVSCCMIAQTGQTEGPETKFNTRFGCPYCGYVLEELEPRLFSFNNPKGACKECNGLGHDSFVDPAKIVPDPTVSLSCGAVSGWERGHHYLYGMLKSLSEHYGFDLDAPFESLPDPIQRIILYGSGKEKIRFRLPKFSGRSYRTFPFEGVVPHMERRLRDSASDAVKDELSKFLSTSLCASCEGSRLDIGARNVFVDGKPIHEVTRMSITQAIEWFASAKFDTQHAQVADRIIRDVAQRLKFLASVGLTYVTLDRSTNTLSGGELQRIRLASQVGSGLVGVTYVLDEPSVGLHDRDNKKLLDTLFSLRDLGNTVVVVEHDESTIRSADYVIDLGPGAGTRGGSVVAAGDPAEIEQCSESLTGAYLSGTRQIPVPATRMAPQADRTLTIVGARGNNLKNIQVDIPLGLLVCVTGVSGSGKSTLVNSTVYPALAKKLHRSRLPAAEHDALQGTDRINKIINIDQQPIGRTPRSNPATYTGLFGIVRDLFASTLEARVRGYKPGRFSFNVSGGRCEACKGDGLVRVAMHFLPDMFVNCETCNGKRYNRETLEITYRGLSIADVLDLTVDDAIDIFYAVPSLYRKLRILQEVGLGYIRLGQNSVTLSGGEAQRIKLSLELSKRDTGSTLYLLDEPTTGLHFEDVKLLLSVVGTLRDRGNSVLIIEHNLDVIKTADWIIDMGPEGGEDGGHVVAAGTPEQVAAEDKSHTGKCLRRALARSRADQDKLLEAV